MRRRWRARRHFASNAITRWARDASRRLSAARARASRRTPGTPGRARRPPSAPRASACRAAARGHRGDGLVGRQQVHDLEREERPITPDAGPSVIASGGWRRRCSASSVVERERAAHLRLVARVARAAAGDVGRADLQQRRLLSRGEERHPPRDADLVGPPRELVRRPVGHHARARRSRRAPAPAISGPVMRSRRAATSIVRVEAPRATSAARSTLAARRRRGGRGSDG